MRFTFNTHIDLGGFCNEKGEDFSAIQPRKTGIAGEAQYLPD